MTGPANRLRWGRQEAGACVMLFDGACGFCAASVRFIARRSSASAIRFCAMQSGTGRAALAALNLPLRDFETLAVVEAGRLRTKSDALLRLAASMRFPWPLLATLARPVPASWRDRLYEFVAANRYRILGRRDSCGLPDPDLRERFLSEPFTRGFEIGHRPSDRSDLAARARRPSA